MTATRPGSAHTGASCSHCRTELPLHVLACPACQTLVHSADLKALAATAQTSAEEGRLEDARSAWMRALELLPPTSKQAGVIRARVEDLGRRIDRTDSGLGTASSDGSRTWWKQGAAGLIAVLLFSAGKLKFLLLGLTKAKTFFSMFAFFGFYWTQFGWPLAAGLVVSIYIHEMGHVHMLRRLGIAAGAPLFIPGLGAFVMLKQHPADALVDAKIGLAGPVWGLGAGLAAYAVFLATGAPIWAAIAQLTGFINLFNLIPIWQLDGSRGFHALGRIERWVAVVAIAAVFVLTGQKLLVIVGAVAIFRAFQRTDVQPHRKVLLVFIGLIVAHALLAMIQPLP